VKIAILGAGPCGLSAAWTLAGQGAHVSVFEKQGGPGGLCRTNRFDGFSFDLGGHRIVSHDTALLKRISDLLGPGLLTRTRKSAILWNGRFIRYPLVPGDLFKYRHLLESAGFLLSLIGSRIRCLGNGRPKADLESFLKDQYGNRLYQRFFRDYTHKVWGEAAKNLSGAWARERIAPFKIRRVMRPQSAAFYYPARGIGHLFEALANDLSGQDVHIHYNACVRGLSVENGNVRAVRIEKNGQAEDFSCDRVISTIPLPELLPLLDLSPRGLTFRGLRFLNIMLSCAEVSDKTWIYVPDKTVLFSRIQEPKKRSSENAPLGRTSVMLEIPCSPGDAVWTMPPDKLFERCMNDLSAIGLGRLKPHVTGYFDTRAGHAYPVWTLDTPAIRTRLLEGVSRFRNLWTCGRQGAFRYVFMDQAMQMGQMAAETVLKDRTVEPRSIYDYGLSREYFEEKIAAIA
jgi:protoporphyrinogen oxidase